MAENTSQLDRLDEYKQAVIEHGETIGLSALKITNAVFDHLSEDEFKKFDGFMRDLLKALDALDQAFDIDRMALGDSGGELLVQMFDGDEEATRLARLLVDLQRGNI